METLEIQRLGRKITGLGDNYCSCVMWHRNSIAFLIVGTWLSFRSANLNFYSTVPAEIWCLYSDNDCDGNEMGSWHLDANSSWKIVKTLPKRIRRLRPQLLGPNFFWNYLLEQLDDQTMALIFFPTPMWPKYSNWPIKFLEIWPRPFLQNTIFRRFGGILTPDYVRTCPITLGHWP